MHLSYVWSREADSNKYFFSSFLNLLKLLIDLIDWGSLFHSFGPTWEKEFWVIVNLWKTGLSIWRYLVSRGWGAAKQLLWAFLNIRTHIEYLLISLISNIPNFLNNSAVLAKKAAPDIIRIAFFCKINKQSSK